MIVKQLSLKRISAYPQLVWISLWITPGQGRKKTRFFAAALDLVKL